MNVARTRVVRGTEMRVRGVLMKTNLFVCGGGFNFGRNSISEMQNPGYQKRGKKGANQNERIPRSLERDTIRDCAYLSFGDWP